MITQMAEYYGETSEIGEISDVDTYEANGITWNYYLDSGIGENYFFGADVNNHIVYITFGTIAQDYYDTCADFMWEIVDGIEAVE